MRHLSQALVLLLFFAPLSLAQSRVEKNIVYATYSGLALLLDVHRPATANGLPIDKISEVRVLDPYFLY